MKEEIELENSRQLRVKYKHMMQYVIFLGGL